MQSKHLIHIITIVQGIHFYLLYLFFPSIFHFHSKSICLIVNENNILNLMPQISELMACKFYSLQIH